MEDLELAAIVVLAVLVTVFDARQGRIPNWLTVGALAVGLLLGGLAGWAGLGKAAAGAAIGFAVGLPVFLVGGFGGGDVKLLAAVGGLVRLEGLPVALATTALVGGCLAAVAIVRRKAVKRTLGNLRSLLILFATSGREMLRAWKGEGPGAPFSVHASEAVTVPYGLAIAAGGLAGVLL